MPCWLRAACAIALPPRRAALLRAFPRKPGARLYRVEFALAGPDPRIALRERAEFDDGEVEEISRRLARYDEPRPWTRTTLELNVDPASLVHALQNHDELTYELLHWSQWIAVLCVVIASVGATRDTTEKTFCTAALFPTMFSKRFCRLSWSRRRAFQDWLVMVPACLILRTGSVRDLWNDELVTVEATIERRIRETRSACTLSSFSTVRPAIFVRIRL